MLLGENSTIAGDAAEETVLNEGGADLRRRLTVIYAALIGGNILIWLWALVVLGDRPVLLGTALLAYTFGLRHAVDADHIAAIDNVTRKLMQQGQRPWRSGSCSGWGSTQRRKSRCLAFPRRKRPTACRSA